MKYSKVLFFLLIISIVVFSCEVKSEDVINNKIKIINNAKDKKVDVFVDGKLFTSFLYSDQISVLKKPVLYPLISANGVAITRGYPLDPRPRERTDHPHHIGAWFNYGDVNGLDFWNNSDAIPPEREKEMGTIRLEKINKLENGNDEAELSVTCKWIDSNGKILLKENTKFVFRAEKNKRVIDRITTLTAQKERVEFKDNKEGMIGIRVARELEHPSDKPVTLSDAHGKKTEVPVLDNSGVTGHYLSSEGIEGMEVWGTRAKWVALTGTIDGNDVTVVIMDYPENVGYPTYWHARGYGLFAANPLGQKIFSNGKNELNFSLQPEESVKFKYRIEILDGNNDKKQIDEEYKRFVDN